jgi:hypothetical protein
MRCLTTVAFLACLIAAPHTVAEEPSRAEAIIALLNDYCLSKIGDWGDLDHRATAEHYDVVTDQTAPPTNGVTSRQKNWLVRSPGGPPTLLTSVDLTNGPVHMFSCGIYAPDLKGTALESSLSVPAHLGNPAKHTHVDGGALVTWWSTQIGSGADSRAAQVMLSREIPGMDGEAVAVILTTEPGAPAKD